MGLGLIPLQLCARNSAFANTFCRAMHSPVGWVLWTHADLSAVALAKAEVLRQPGAWSPRRAPYISTTGRVGAKHPPYILATAPCEGVDGGEGAEEKVLKEGRTSTVWRVVAAGGRPLIVKRHNRACERGLVHGVIGPSRSMAAFRHGHALLARGIATARPVAAADRRGGGAVRDTLVMAEVVAGEPLSDWLRRSPPAADRRRVVWKLAKMIRRMHDAGFSHRDLKAPNIIITPAGGPGGQPVLVDLDGLRERPYVSARRRARDLMRLSVSLDEWGVARQTDRLRFLRTYLGARGCLGAITIRRQRGDRRPARRLRRWWRRIARLSERKLAALRRKGALPEPQP